MPTLYVRNVPRDRYEALRKQAKRNGRSIREEVIAVLRESVAREKELRRRYKTILQGLGAGRSSERKRAKEESL